MQHLRAFDPYFFARGETPAERRLPIVSQDPDEHTSLLSAVAINHHSASSSPADLQESLEEVPLPTYATFVTNIVNKSLSPAMAALLALGYAGVALTILQGFQSEVDELTPLFNLLGLIPVAIAFFDALARVNKIQFYSVFQLFSRLFQAVLYGSNMFLFVLQAIIAAIVDKERNNNQQVTVSNLTFGLICIGPAIIGALSIAQLLLQFDKQFPRYKWDKAFGRLHKMCYWLRDVATIPEELDTKGKIFRYIIFALMRLVMNASVVEGLIQSIAPYTPYPLTSPRGQMFRYGVSPAAALFVELACLADFSPKFLSRLNSYGRFALKFIQETLSDFLAAAIYAFSNYVLLKDDKKQFTPMQLGIQYITWMIIFVFPIALTISCSFSNKCKPDAEEVDSAPDLESGTELLRIADNSASHMSHLGMMPSPRASASDSAAPSRSGTSDTPVVHQDRSLIGFSRTML